MIGLTPGLVARTISSLIVKYRKPYLLFRFLYDIGICRIGYIVSDTNAIH